MPKTKGTNVCAVFDNEEVGLNTNKRAMSTFMKDALKRINASLDLGLMNIMQQNLSQ